MAPALIFIRGDKYKSPHTDTELEYVRSYLYAGLTKHFFRYTVNGKTYEVKYSAHEAQELTPCTTPSE